MTRRARNITLGVILIIGLTCILMVLLRAYAAELQTENNALTTENEELQGEVDTLSVKIESANNIAHIEDVAINELGMVYPDATECIYVTDADEPEKNFAAVIRKEAYQ